MNKEFSIAANLNEPRLLKNVVEKLASRHVDLGFASSTVPGNWKAIETSCIMAYVLGTFDVHINRNGLEEQANIPFSSCFLFTCIKDKFGSFNLEWSSSLS